MKKFPGHGPPTSNIGLFNTSCCKAAARTTVPGKTNLTNDGKLPAALGIQA